MLFGFVWCLVCLSLSLLGEGEDQVDDTNYEASIVNPTDLWKYNAIPQSTDEWKTATVNWPETNAFPNVTTITRYYRKSIGYINKNIYYAFIMSLNTQTGFIFYINGYSFFKWNLPDSVGPYTPANSSVSASVYRACSRLSLSFDIQENRTLELAVEVHFTEEELGKSDPFACYLSIVKGDNYRRITGKGEAVSSQWTPSHQRASMAVDNHVETKWGFLDEQTAIWMTWQYNDGRREVINKYSITTAENAPDYDPVSWNVYASNDMNTWVLLNYQENIMWSARHQTRYFLMNHIEPFNAYKLEIVSKSNPSSSHFQIAEWNLLLSNLPYTGSHISYPMVAYLIAALIEDVNIKPEQSGFVDWEIVGEADVVLPRGLYFNSRTGTISGKAQSVLDAASFHVCAKDSITGVRRCTWLILTVYACELPNYVYLLLEKSNFDETQEEYEIYDGSKNLVFSYKGELVGSFHVCLPVGIYSIRLLSSDGGKWQSSSFLSIYIIHDEEKFILTKARLKKNWYSSFPLNTLFTIPFVDQSHSALVYYGESIPSGWDTPSFAPSWEQYVAPVYPNVYRAFFYIPFTVTTLSSFHGLEIDLLAKDGVLSYMNGIEVYRDRLDPGSITNATQPIGGTVYSIWRRFIVSLSHLHVGENHISIAIVIVSSGGTQITFNAFGRMLENSNAYPRYFDTSTSSPTLFDQDDETRIYDPVTTLVDYMVYSILFAEMNRELVSKYCLVTDWDDSKTDPYDWDFYGCEMTSCRILDSQRAVIFPSRKTEYCFYISRADLAYDQFILAIISTRVNDIGSFLGLSQMNLYVEVIDEEAVPALKFSPSIVTAYVGEAFPHIVSSSEYYSHYLISPPLPTGLTMDLFTGAILGMVDSAMQATPYTVTASLPTGTIRSTTLTLSGASCPSTSVFFTLEFYMESGGKDVAFSLVNLSNNVVVESRNSLYGQSYFTIPMCKPQSTYSLILSKLDTSGWGKNTVRVRLADGNILMSESLPTGLSSKGFSFNPVYSITPHTSEWHYLVNGSVAPEAWNTLKGMQSSWPFAAEGDFPVAQGVTQYYYCAFVVASLESFSILDITINVKAGAIIYLNGVTIRVVNLPSYGVTAQTVATKQEVAAVYVTTGVSLQAGIVQAGTNILAVELHHYQYNEEKNSFDGSCIFVLDNMYIILEGTGTTDPMGDEANDGSCKLFDNNSSTKTFIKNKCVGVEIFWTFPYLRQEPINRYGIATSGSCNSYHPSGWMLYGSNGASWVPLHQRNDQHFASAFEIKRYNFYNENAYNKYRLVITECNNVNWEDDTSECDGASFHLSDLYFYTKKVYDYCPAIDSFKPALSGDYSYSSCPELYTGYMYRLCSNRTWEDPYNNCRPSIPQAINYPSPNITMNQGRFTSVTPAVVAAEYTVLIYPSLPSGLSLDNTTGTISGVPYTLMAKTYYVLYVSNDAGRIVSSITIEIITSSTDWVLVLTVLLIGMLVLFGLIVYMNICIMEMVDNKSDGENHKIIIRIIALINRLKPTRKHRKHKHRV